MEGQFFFDDLPSPGIINLKRINMPILVCNSCQKAFYGLKRKNRPKRYCSKHCSNEGKRIDHPKRSCLKCNKEFLVYRFSAPSLYCSKKCVIRKYVPNPNRIKKIPTDIWNTYSKEERFIAIKKQFEKHVIKNIGCWAWKKKPLATGYGCVYTGKRKLISAHRVSWIIHRGDIPEGLFVLHSCDNRICTNPDHLFLGTHIDNMRDMKMKGRTRKKKEQS